MGQYHKFMNFDKKEILNPPGLLKLMEWSYQQNEYMLQIENLLKKYKTTDLVFYDSPNRILTSLEIIKEIRPNSKVAIGRELTKVFEEIVIDYTEKVIEYFTNNTLKGEIVGLVFRDENKSDDIDINEKIGILKSKSFKAKEISIILSELYGLNKNDVYKKCLN